MIATLLIIIKKRDDPMWKRKHVSWTMITTEAGKCGWI